MKKVITLLLALCLIMTACGKTEPMPEVEPVELNFEQTSTEETTTEEPATEEPIVADFNIEEEKEESDNTETLYDMDFDFSEDFGSNVGYSITRNLDTQRITLTMICATDNLDRASTAVIFFYALSMENEQYDYVLGVTCDEMLFAFSHDGITKENVAYGINKDGSIALGVPDWLNENADNNFLQALSDSMSEFLDYVKTDSAGEIADEVQDLTDIDQQPNTDSAVAYDDGIISVRFDSIGHDSLFDDRYTVNVLIENNADYSIEIYCDDLAINGFMANPSGVVTIMPGKKAIMAIRLNEEDCKRTAKTDITDISVSFHYRDNNDKVMTTDEIILMGD